MGITEYRATGGNKAMLNDYHRKLDSAANFQLNFLPSDKQKYAFDYLGSGDHGIFSTDEYYPKSRNYDFRYKSIEIGKTDYVKVEISDLKNFTHGGSNWHSVYNSDQKLVLETYDKNIKDDNFYLFFVDNVLDKKDSLGTSVSGYMPRGYNCGFIYEGGSLHTVAHELGHGVGNLEHAFSASNSSGKTQNLMDYSTGEELWHFQWDQIQDPSRVWMKWNKAEEEGENVEWLDDDAKYVVWVYSPYFSNLINGHLNNWNSEPSLDEARRIAELYLQASIKDLKNKRDIAANVNNGGGYVNVDDLKKVILSAQKCAKIKHRLGDPQKKFTIFYLVSGTQEVDEVPENQQSIDLDYYVKRIEWKVKDMFDYMADTDFDETQYAGQWVANETKAYSNRKQLSYKRHFEFDNGYYNTYYKLLELENGDLFLAKPDKYSDNLEISYYIKPKGVKSWYSTKLEFFPISTDVTNKTDAIAFEAFKFVGRYVIPIEDVLILIDGKDFDGEDASRLVSTGFLILEVFQVGKVFKLCKGITILSALSNQAQKKIIIKTTKQISQDVAIDLCCQFFVHMLREFDKNSSITFKDLIKNSFSSFSWNYKSSFIDAANSLLYNNNEANRVLLTCVKEFTLALNEGMSPDDFYKNGYYNCVIEIFTSIFRTKINNLNISGIDLNTKEKFIKLLQDNISNNSLGYRILDDWLRTYFKN